MSEEMPMDPSELDVQPVPHAEDNEVQDPDEAVAEAEAKWEELPDEVKIRLIKMADEAYDQDHQQAA